MSRLESREAVLAGRPDAAGATRLVLLGDARSLHIHRWAEYFAARAWDVHVISLRSGEIPGVTVHPLRSWLPGRLGYLTVIPVLRGLMRRLRPALVHAHYATSYGLLGVLSGARPLIVSLWGSDVYEWPEKGPLHRALLRFNLRHAGVVCATSRGLAEAARPYAPAGRFIEVTPFGVDLARFTPVPDHAGPVVIGTARGLEWRYGIDLLIRAFALLDHPEARLVIAGEGPQRAEYEALIATLGLAGRVELAGWVDPAEIPATYRRFDVFVAPSRIEAFGVAVLEAAAAGLPAVVSSVGGLLEVVEDQVTGLTVPPEDPEALAAALDALIRDPERRRQMGVAARRFVESRYAWADTAQRMERLYWQVLTR